MLDGGTTKDENLKVAKCAKLLESSPQVLPTLAKVAQLVTDGKPLSNEEHSPKVELKPFPSSLRYEFLNSNSTYPMIVNASLSTSQIGSLF